MARLPLERLFDDPSGSRFDEWQAEPDIWNCGADRSTAVRVAGCTSGPARPRRTRTRTVTPKPVQPPRGGVDSWSHPNGNEVDPLVATRDV